MSYCNADILKTSTQMFLLFGTWGGGGVYDISIVKFCHKLPYNIIIHLMVEDKMGKKIIKHQFLSSCRRLAKYLPLPIANDDQRPNLDFIVFLLEMNNAQR